jgi:hypothetical protein
MMQHTQRDAGRRDKMAYEIEFPASLDHLLTEEVYELWYRISDCAIELKKDREDRVMLTSHEGEGSKIV